MSWWEWLLISIGLYLITGLVSGLVEAYVTGRTDSRWDVSDLGFTLAVWPLLLIMVCIIIPEMTGKWLNARGRTYKDRKAEADEAKRVQKDVKELAQEYGFDPKKVKSA